MLNAAQSALLEQYIDSDPMQVALKTRDREVAQQVAVLQKAQEKLPSYYAARCFIPQISYEQCTSEIVAANRRFPAGNLAVDLTCGLGVDTLALSKNYKKVITCEIDPEKAEIARYNFTKLGVENIEVLNCSAEDFLAKFSDHVDLIFCDPSRRSSVGSKVCALQDCAPNIVELMPRLKQLARNIIVKISPLFDVAELFNIFGNEIEVETVSHRNECKEVVMRVGQDVARANHLSVTIIRGGSVFYDAYPFSMEFTGQWISVDKAKYIYIPDVAFAKSRTVECYMTKNFHSIGYKYDSFLLTDKELENFEGRGFEIRVLMPYKAKELKRYLVGLKIRGAVIHIKNFPYGVGDIKKQLGIVEGADAELFFFRLSGVPMVCLAVLR